MKKVYQVGAHTPVSTYKKALRQHAKYKMHRYNPVWRQSVGCSAKYDVNHWGFKTLIKQGKYIGWGDLKIRSNF